MKKIIIWGVAILLIALFIIIIKIARDYKMNKRLELTYEINAGIPFKWEYEIEDPSIVEFKKSYVVSDENKNGLVGGSIVTNYVFVGKKEGKTKITFKYVSITNEEYPPLIEEHIVKVDKDLNIKEVKDKNE